MMHPDTYKIRRALISVSDKSGVVELAQGLRDRGVEIISTGGTAAKLREAGVEVRSISDVTGFPEVMDGRVKTLHPRVHGALLALLDNDQHRAQMDEHGIESIDLLVCNLYPFEQTIQSGAGHADIIENIDIGGPAMVRASAKNYRWTAVVTSVERYADLLADLDAHNGAVTERLRMDLAREAFAHTARYDSLIADYLTRATGSSAVERGELSFGGRRQQKLRYGENPHQTAALYGRFTEIHQKLHGKELSYNNIVDMDAAARLILEFDEPAAAIIKHTNPCGTAIGATLAEAYERAFASDTQSPFGGIIAFNRELDIEAAQAVDKIFTEVLLAPSYAPDALELLQKKKNRRLIQLDLNKLRESLGMEFRSVAGGFLVQSTDDELIAEAGLRVVTKRAPSDEEMQALMFAWRVAKHVKSNAIVYAAADRVLSVGAGQMSRVDSASVAAAKAERFGLSLQGSAVASDAFFPFPDGLLQTVEAGARAVIQPGGSIRDEEVIAAADEHDVAMVFAGNRHFRH